MYSYEHGWMREWRPDGDFRVRFAPVPRCQKWIQDLKQWVECESNTLWIPEVRRFHRRERRRSRAHKFQPELDGLVVTPLTHSPPRPDPGWPASRLWNTMPVGWMDMLEPIKVMPWRCLEFLHGLGSAAEDLFNSNPGLAWLLATRLLQGRGEKREAAFHHLQSRLGRRQRNLLELLDLPPRPWMVKLLRKIQCDLDPGDTLLSLRALARDETARQYFQHAEPMPGRVWRVVRTETTGLLTPELLEEIRALNDNDPTLRSVQENLYDLGILAQRGEKVPPFRNILEMEQWRWMRSAEMGMLNMPRRLPLGEFPAHPFPGTESILPIHNRELLRAESRRMHHCVSTYEIEIQRGQVAVYAVFRPERATLGLRKSRDGVWRIMDLKCICNRSPSAETRRVVEEWLQKHR